MKVNFKRMTATALALALSLGGAALAVKTTVTKNLSYQDITVSLEGKTIETKNVNGEFTEPFAIDGTTYLPIRAVGEALGLYVDWDGAKNQVVLSSTPIDKGEHKPVTFYLVRHGETQFNVEKLMQGWCDAPLTKAGESQAAKLAQGLKSVPFVAAYSSTSERAMDTANAVLAVGDRGLNLQLSKNLREMYYGTAEGKPQTALPTDRPLNDYLTKGFDNVGGETWAQLNARMKSTLDEAAKTYAPLGGNILVTTHGMSIMATLQALFPKDIQSIMAQISHGLDNCSVTTVEYNNGVWTLKGINDTSYLK